MTPSQHVAYVAGWIKALEQDPREIFRAAADAEKIVQLVRSYELGQEQGGEHSKPEEQSTEQARLTSPSGAPQPTGHYASMIASRTDHLPPTIRENALARMVDFATPDIVLPSKPHDPWASHRYDALGGWGSLMPDGVAALYSQRSIRQEDAEQFMDKAVVLADWARGLAQRAGLSAEDADQAAAVLGTIQLVQWEAGRSDADNGPSLIHEGWIVASEDAVAFASKGPAQASLASLIMDMTVPPDMSDSLSLGQLYRPDEQRVPGLQSRDRDQGNPGADLVASAEAPLPKQQQSLLATLREVPTMIRDSSPALRPPSPERTYLAVPYAEKDEAKQLGAKWDRAEKAWYVPAGVGLEAFTPWLPAKDSVHIAVDANPAEQFAEALRESGLQLDGAPQMDGQLHRVRAEGDQGAERSGAYRGHLDGRPAGFIQNHRMGLKQNWKASGPAVALDARDRVQMAAEAAQKRHDRAHEREQQAERVAQQVDALWTAATPVQVHPYLADKGVQSHGLRQDEAGRLLVPVQDADGRLQSVQKIGADGFKQFQEGSRVEGGHFVIGNVRQPGPILIAEGYATAATLHEMTDMPSVVAFNAGNLLPVAQTYRALDPDRAIYIAGDDDRQRAAELDAQGRPKLNVGRVKAEEAAAAIGGQAVFPSFPEGIQGTDWNDLANAVGRTQASQQLRTGIAIANRELAAQGLGAARDGATQEQERGVFQSVGQAIGKIGKAFSRERAQVRELEHDQGR